MVDEARYVTIPGDELIPDLIYAISGSGNLEPKFQFLNHSEFGYGNFLDVETDKIVSFYTDASTEFILRI